jgi:hypothetical protein
MLNSIARGVVSNLACPPVLSRLLLREDLCWQHSPFSFSTSQTFHKISLWERQNPSLTAKYAGQGQPSRKRLAEIDPSKYITCFKDPKCQTNQKGHQLRKTYSLIPCITPHGLFYLYFYLCLYLSYRAHRVGAITCIGASLP